MTTTLVPFSGLIPVELLPRVRDPELLEWVAVALTYGRLRGSIVHEPSYPDDVDITDLPEVFWAPDIKERIADDAKLCAALRAIREPATEKEIKVCLARMVAGYHYLKDDADFVRVLADAITSLRPSKGAIETGCRRYLGTNEFVSIAKLIEVIERTEAMFAVACHVIDVEIPQHRQARQLRQLREEEQRRQSIADCARRLANAKSIDSFAPEIVQAALHAIEYAEVELLPE